MPALQLRSKRLEEFPCEWRQQIFDIIADFVNCKLPQKTAIEKVNNLCPVNRTGTDKEHPTVFFGEFWTSLLNIAEQIPSSNAKQDKLAAFVKALSKLKCSKTVKIWGRTHKLWKDLPFLGVSAYEEMNSKLLPKVSGDIVDSNILPARRPPYLEWEPNHAEKQQHWQNLNAFLARLTSLKIWLFHQYAICALREALEDKPDRRSVKSCSEYPTSETLELQLPIAAKWIELAGNVLVKLDFEFEGEIGRGDRLWKGKKGFCRERWRLWRTRFIEISELEGAREKTVEVARRTAELMLTMERSQTEDQ
jgi:hypothetical protein